MQDRRTGKDRRANRRRLRAVRLVAVLGIYVMYAAMLMVAWNAIAC